MKSRATSLGIVAVAYALASAAGWLTLRLVPFSRPMLALSAADFVATCVIFLASLATNNSSVYDPYWSVAPPLLAGYLMTLATPTVPSTRQWLVLSLIVFWAIRLTYNWVRGWSGLHHEDWRYVDIRLKTGRGYWPASFFGLHLFPTVMVFLGCCCLWPALAVGSRPLCLLDGVAALVGFASVMIELVADEQLRAFRRQPAQANKTMDSGLWRVSRHPNYLGEIGFWLALALFGYAAQPAIWVFGGVLAITTMFIFASIPLAEKRALTRRPEYAQRMKRTRMLLPWPPR